ncbi:hypothetical protein B0H67DRAFT_574687 [Lasiosphaeris hirsuta]|uniref:Uncharacterized protein n=1 Tax=Lasiosphaeris hirsuta TaxID=260670 RepID=A0AA40AQ49_9PEZI|nr:hypothetical protein B0H67DRAFT_574687 [Lasiosphaeris hirsuta]
MDHGHLQTQVAMILSGWTHKVGIFFFSLGLLRCASTSSNCVEVQLPIPHMGCHLRSVVRDTRGPRSISFPVIQWFPSLTEMESTLMVLTGMVCVVE